MSLRPLDAPTLAHLESELDRLEKLHLDKVVDLTRRLRPGLTLEDIRNPHDFPELDDPDWHYADGQLAGVQSVLTMIRSLRRERDQG